MRWASSAGTACAPYAKENQPPGCRPCRTSPRWARGGIRLDRLDAAARQDTVLSPLRPLRWSSPGRADIDHPVQRGVEAPRAG